MAKLKVDHILMEVSFPPSYPFAPPFCRVIRPRFRFMTGHITIGGSVCTELLTQSGWVPQTTMVKGELQFPVSKFLNFNFLF